jgi:hypothetical protein
VDGTGGQNNSVLGTYATLPWYANDLGHRAALGFSQYQRQDLVGGRYALLGISHDNEALARGDPVRIHPDFWVAFLWKRIMGNTVFNATAGALHLDPAVRAYAHCGIPPSPHAPARTVTPTKERRGRGRRRGEGSSTTSATSPPRSMPTGLLTVVRTAEVVPTRNATGMPTGMGLPMGITLVNLNSTLPKQVKLRTTERHSINNDYHSINND